MPLCAPVCVCICGGQGQVGWACSDLPFCVVDCIAKAWCVHNGEPQPHTLFLYVHCVLSNLHSLHDPLWRRGKLRPGQGQGPTQSEQTACRSQLHAVPPTPLPSCLGPFLWEPARSTFPNTGNAAGCWLWPQPLLLGFLESSRGQRLIQRAGLCTQIIRELAGGLPG